MPADSAPLVLVPGSAGHPSAKASSATRNESWWCADAISRNADARHRRSASRAPAPHGSRLRGASTPKSQDPPGRRRSPVPPQTESPRSFFNYLDALSSEILEMVVHLSEPFG